MSWNLLQVSDVLDIEFASALAERVPVTAWEPQRSYLPSPFRRSPAPDRHVPDPPLTIKRFPLLHGFARFPISAIARTGVTVSQHLLRHTESPKTSPLICTVPYFAPVAERWPGPVVYWLTDLIERYQGADPAAIHRLDRQMCRAATLVCPNSSRLAAYLIEHGACPPEKIRILPNATRATNLLAAPPSTPFPLPPDLADLPRPVAGIIGNLAGNMDWLFLEQLVRLQPDIHWAFIGPTSMPIEDRAHQAARERVMHLPNTRFTGRKPYGELAAYARAFDVAILPYRRCEPTYSGSSTRFYEHLAACRPMIATRGFEELLRKQPLLQLVDTAEEAAHCLSALQQQNFDDGLLATRWQQSQGATWQARAGEMVQALQSVNA